MKRLLPHDPPPELVAYELESGRVIFVHSLPTLPHIVALTPAEREVAALLLSGCDNAGIATARGTSLRTSVNQVASIFRKLGVSSRAELAAKVYAANPDYAPETELLNDSIATGRDTHVKGSP